MSLADILQDFAWVPALMVAVTAGLLLLLRDLRQRLTVLAIQYGFLGWMTALELDFGVALGKLAAGVFGCAILAITVRGAPARSAEEGEPQLAPRSVFNLFSILLMIVVGWNLGRTGWIEFMDLGVFPGLGAHWLFLIGLLHLGTTQDPDRIAIGLFTTLSGFEVAYSSLESSLAVHALLACITLALAFSFSYLLTGSMQEEASPEIA